MYCPKAPFLESKIPSFAAHATQPQPNRCKQARDKHQLMLVRLLMQQINISQIQISNNLGLGMVYVLTLHPSQ